MQISMLLYLHPAWATHISGVLDLFFPLKNSGRALRSIACTLEEDTCCYETAAMKHIWSSGFFALTCCNRTRQRSWE